MVDQDHLKKLAELPTLRDLPEEDRCERVHELISLGLVKQMAVLEIAGIHFLTFDRWMIRTGKKIPRRRKPKGELSQSADEQ